MKLLSHVHINGNGLQNNLANTRMVGKVAKKMGYTHTVLGCHIVMDMPSCIDECHS